MLLRPIAAVLLLALAACVAEPVPTATLAPAAPAPPAAVDEQFASLPSAPITGPAQMVRGDIALPPSLPGVKRASLTAAEAPSVDRIVVHKMDRRMELVRDEAVLRTYKIDLGWQTMGHKQHAGDGRTPEGIYSIEMRNPRSAFHRALKISYPNQDDTANARARGLSPGGLIMIHGQPNNPRSFERAQAKRDWTEGCIAVSNEEIEEIWAMVADGTTIEIRP